MTEQRRGQIEEILESDEFAYQFSLMLKRELTDGQAGILGYYLYYDRTDDAGRYLGEIMGERAKWLAKRMLDNDA